MPRAILIVEDSTAMRSFLVSTLEEMGEFEFFETGSGFEAIKLLPRHRFDLIITDINMPDINGLELVSFVKRNPAYSGIPLIIVSTERSPQDRERGMNLGANEYLGKPFQPEELRRAVGRCLGEAIEQ